MVHGTAARRLAALVVVATLAHATMAFGAVQATPPPASAAAGSQKQGPPQPPKPPPTAVLRGRVTTYPDGRPVARARVLLTRPDKSYARVTITGADGRYEITQLEDFDNYMLSANKTGFAARVWGEQPLPAPPTPLKLAAGQILESIDVALAAHLSLSGRILDEDGTPFAGAVVSALRSVIMDGRRELIPVAEIITNDKGDYRLFGLPAGLYFISAIDPAFLSAGDHLGPLEYPPTYYPGVPSAEEATRVTLDPGQPREGVDFKLNIVKPMRIIGKMSAYSNDLFTSGIVAMTPVRADGSLSTSASEVDIRPDGRFIFTNVPPGRFLIRARAETENEPVLLFGHFAVTVTDRDISGAEMTLLAGARLDGLVEWEGNSPRPVDTAMRVRAPMSDGNTFGDALNGKIEDDDTFVLAGAMVGRHLIRVENLPEPWTLKSVYFKGQDVTDIPLAVEPGHLFSDIRLILTDKPTRLEGRLVSVEGDDMESYRVVIFSANPLHWGPASRYVTLARPNREGRFTLRGLPPGVYRLAASRALDETDLFDPRTLDQLAPTATTIRLNEGQQAAVDVRVRPSRASAGMPALAASR